MKSTASLQRVLGLIGSLLGIIATLIALLDNYSDSLLLVLIFGGVLGIVFSILYKSTNIISSIILIICSILFFLPVLLSDFIMKVFQISIISTLFTFSSGIIGITSEFRKK